MNEWLLIHFTTFFVYYLIYSRQQRERAFCEAMLVLFIPLFGLLLLLIVKIFEKRYLSCEDPSYVYRSFEHEQAFFMEHEQQSEAVLAMQDVLLLTDTGTKRKLLGAAIRKDILRNNEVLLTALRDEDTEISHYAVSLVSRRIRDLEEVFYRLQKRLAEVPTDVPALREYIDAIDVYLKSSNMDAASRNSLQQEQIVLLERLLHLDRPEEKYFLMKIEGEIELKNYEKAEVFCQMFIECFPDSEQPYLSNIKLAYHLADARKIQQSIRQLKNSAISFSQRALAVIRFWDRSEQHAS